jgi:hypothetical protein
LRCVKPHMQVLLTQDGDRRDDLKRINLLDYED